MVLALVRPQLALSDPNSQSAAEAVNVELEVVIAGTATRVPLFQDAAGTVPLAQPIRTGARGFTQEFYVQVDTLTTVLAWRSGGLQGGFLTIEGQAAAQAQDAVEKADATVTRAETALSSVDLVPQVPGMVADARAAAQDASASAGRARTEGREAAVETLAGQPAVVDAAAAAVGGQVEQLGLIGSGQIDSDTRSMVMTDENGNELWVEAGPDGLPTQAVADRIGAKMTTVPTSDYPDASYPGLVTEDGSVIMQLDPETGNITPAQAEVWNRVLSPKSDDVTVTAVPAATKTMLASISNGVVKYLLATWVPARYASQTGDYLTLPGAGKIEGEVRPTAEAAYGIASLLASGSYNAAATGISEATARATCARLTSSLAYRHRATAGDPAGWGGGPAPWATSASGPSPWDWQAAMWAYLAGHAAWFTWADLATADQARVRAMVEWEANRFLRWKVPYYVRGTQTIYPGDSQFETVAWNAQILALALVMFPDHANSDRWLTKLTELHIAAAGRPSDTTSALVVNATPVRDVLATSSNLNDDGTVTNHDQIHPDYMASVGDLWMTGVLLASGGGRLPRSSVLNGSLVYRAMVDHVFASPPYAAPGGTIYQRDGSGNPVGTLYYPGTPDWGDRPLVFGQLDVLAGLLGMDTRASVKASVWAPLHLQRTVTQQARNTTGQIYQAGDTGYNADGRAETMSSFLAGRALWAASINPTAIRSTDVSPAMQASQNRGL